MQGRLFLTMVKIGKIKSDALASMKKCWAETTLISLLDIGYTIAVYIFIILAARLAGLHTANSVMPEFDRLTPGFAVFAGVTILIAYLIKCPFYFGIRWYYWHAANGNLMPLSSVFACYSSTGTVSRCILLKFLTDLRSIAFSFIFGGILFLEYILACRLWEYDSNSIIRLLIGTGFSVLALGLILLYIAFTLKYIPVGYLFADDPYGKISDILHLSSSIVNKRYGNLLALYLSCWKGIVSVFLLFPIPLIQMLANMYTAVFLRECLDGGKPAPEPVDEPSERMKILTN